MYATDMDEKISLLWYRSPENGEKKNPWASPERFSQTTQELQGVFWVLSGQDEVINLGSTRFLSPGLLHNSRLHGEAVDIKKLFTFRHTNKP